MIVEKVNFEGDWEDTCAFCGEKQKAHMQVDEADGIRYERRLPCDPEKDSILKEYVGRAKKARWLMTVYQLVLYGISKIPFISELRLVKSIAARHLGHRFPRRPQ